MDDPDEEEWEYIALPDLVVDYTPPEVIGLLWLPGDEALEVVEERPTFGFARHLDANN